MNSKLIGFILLFAVFGCKEETLFEKISAEQSGVDFVNNLEETPAMNVFNYLYFYNGGGVAAGDLNQDGLPDLYFTSNLEENKLYLNKGDFKFEDITENAKVGGKKGWSTGVTMADVNSDGLLDIYVGYLGDYQNIRGRNQLYINQGNDAEGRPMFKEEARKYGLDLKGFSTQGVFFDYDLDNDLDFFQLNHSVHGNGTYAKADMRTEKHNLSGDRFFRNDNDKFVEVTDSVGIYSSALGYGLGVGISDLDGNGYPDIYVGNDFHENDYLYLNQGDGTFKEALEQSMPHTSRFSMGNDLADLNNDGMVDLVSLDMLPEDPVMLKQSAAEDSYEIYKYKLKFGYNHQFARNTLQINRGNGKFSDTGLLSGIAATDWSWATLVADFDLDGYKDIFIANGIKRRSNDLDYINYVSNEAVQAKLDGDLTTEDLRLTEKMPVVKIPNYAYRNKGDLSFEKVSDQWGLGEESFSNGAAYADLDQDGDLDLIINNVDQPAFIYRNNTIENTGKKSLSVKFEGPKGNASGIGAIAFLYEGDKSQVLENYLTRGYLSSVSDPVTFSVSERVDSLVVIWPDKKTQVFNSPKPGILKANYREADFSNRGSAVPERIFKKVSNKVLNYKHQENDFAEFNRDNLVPHMNSTEGPFYEAADLNNDGFEDLIIGGARDVPTKIFYGTADGFKLQDNPGLAADSLAEDAGMVLLDYDRDGDKDLVIASGGNEFRGKSPQIQVRFYKNNQGQFERDLSNKPEVFVNASVIRKADIDQDGDEDLFVGGRILPWKYGVSPPSFLLEQTNPGQFEIKMEIPKSLQQAGMVKDAQFYQDKGLLKLVVASEWQPIKIFTFKSGDISFFEIPNSSGWWNTVVPFDLNQDGNIDIVGGNLGLNSKLKANPDEPLMMRIGDFDDNGQLDQLIYHYLNGKQYLFATKDEVVKQLPKVKSVFPDYQTYATGEQVQLFSEQQKEITLKATELRSGVFINQEGGSYDFKPFDNPAQLAPIKAILPIKIEDDNYLITAGNQYEVNTQRGRYDADYGGLIKVTENGELEWIDNQRSGLYIEGQVRQVVTIKDQNQIIFLTNNDSARVYGTRQDLTIEEI
jgi:hypothetical protein